MIRHALPIDYEDILHIKQVLMLDLKRIYNTAYKIEVEQRGFLLPSEYTREEFHEELRKIFLVVEIEGTIIGFLRIDTRHDFSKDSPLHWIQPGYKDTYFSTPHAVIGGIGVLPEYAHHGYGAQLLEGTIEEVSKKRIPELFSIVTTSPVCNYPSLKFHERNGFIKVAEREKGDTFDMHDYQSVLFMKPI